MALEGLTDASSQAQGFKTDVQGIGTAASEAATQAAPLSGAVDKTAASLKTAGSATGELSGALKDKLGPAGDVAFKAFEKLSNTQGIRGLATGIVSAQNAMEAFKRAVKDAEASGTKMPPSVGNALKTMQSDITAATGKLGTLKNQIGDVTVKSQAMAEGWKQASSAGGSMGSMMSNLAEGTTGLGSGLAKVGLGLGGVIAAFAVGYTEGKKFSVFMKTLGVDIDVSAKSWAGWASAVSAALAKTAPKDSALVRWLKDLGDSTRDYSALLTPLTGKMNENLKAHQALGLQIKATDSELKKLGIGWVTAGTATEKLDKQLELVAVRFAEAAAKGEPLNKTVLANAAGMEVLDKAIKEEGRALDTLTPQMQAAIFIHREQATAQEKVTNAAKAAETALKAQAQAERDLAAAVRAANAAFDAQAASVKTRNDGIDAATQKTKDLAAAQREGIVVEGQATVVTLTQAVATQEATAALIAMLEAQGRYTESLKHTLSIATGWSDYLANIKESYDQGVTSILTYKLALADFLHTLQTQFPTATGTAKAALQEMIGVVGQLIATAGGPQDTDWSAGGALNRQFNKP